MKMGMKKMTVTAVILVVIGGALFMAARGLGAGGYITWGRGGLHIGGKDEASSLSRRGLEGVKSVKVDAVEADVEFIPADDFGFDIVTYDGEPEWNLSGGVLTVREPARRVWLFNIVVPSLHGDEEMAYIKIYYPESAALDELDVRSVSGDIEFPGVGGRLRSASFESTSGDVGVESLGADKLMLKNVSGNIRARGAVSPDADVNTTSGNISLEGFSGNIDAGTVSGRVEIAAEELSGKLTSASGDVTAMAAAPDFSVSTVSGGVYVSTSAREDEVACGVETTTGAVTVDGRKIGGSVRTSRGGRFAIDVKTISGDVEIMFDAVD
jgi:lia operon protein LiaG